MNLQIYTRGDGIPGAGAAPTQYGDHDKTNGCQLNYVTSKLLLSIENGASLRFRRYDLQLNKYNESTLEGFAHRLALDGPWPSHCMVLRETSFSVGSFAPVLSYRIVDRTFCNLILRPFLRMISPP